jgi:hypothetical protein
MGLFRYFGFYGYMQSFNNALLPILPNGFVWLFYVFGVQFHICVSDSDSNGTSLTAIKYLSNF